MSRLLVTGANGRLGRRLLQGVAGPTRALVRSQRAALQLAEHGDVRIADYADADGLTAACTDCEAVAHLVGIVKEGANATYRAAHEEATATLVEAARRARVRRIVYLSVLGADEGSPNRCLASKARAESLLLHSNIPALVLRVPMVLGEGDPASRALLANARRRIAFTFRATSREQPIYAGDVVAAVEAGLDASGPTGVVELAGPRSLTRRELIAAASVIGTRTVSLPPSLGPRPGGPAAASHRQSALERGYARRTGPRRPHRPPISSRCARHPPDLARRDPRSNFRAARLIDPNTGCPPQPTGVP